MKRLTKDNLNDRHNWEEQYQTSGSNITEYQRLRYQLISLNIPNEPINVTDLGCGTGTVDFILKDRCPSIHLTGVDIVQPIYPTIFDEFIRKEVTDTGLKDQDYVVACEILEHIEEPQKLVDEIYRMLKSAGRVCLTTPLENKLPSEYHLWSFEIEDVKEMFVKAGFSKVWTFPWSSGINIWDEIFCFAEK